jgi:hypothetical protein
MNATPSASAGLSLAHVLIKDAPSAHDWGAVVLCLPFSDETAGSAGGELPGASAHVQPNADIDVPFRKKSRLAAQTARRLGWLERTTYPSTGVSRDPTGDIAAQTDWLPFSPVEGPGSAATLGEACASSQLSRYRKAYDCASLRPIGESTAKADESSAHVPAPELAVVVRAIGAAPRSGWRRLSPGSAKRVVLRRGTAK